MLPVLLPPSSPEDFQDLSSLSLEEAELLAPSMEVSASLSVCGNIHQAQYYPFWTEVLKCGDWHKNILREGLRLDFIDGILPSAYDERNNLSARREPAFVRDSLDSMTSSGILNHVLVKPTCVNPLTVASRELDTGSRKLRLLLGWVKEDQPDVEEDVRQADALPQSRGASIRR